jgi:hypothetical protein
MEALGGEKPVCVGFVVDKVTLRQDFFSQYFGFHAVIFAVHRFYQLHTQQPE